MSVLRENGLSASDALRVSELFEGSDKECARNNEQCIKVTISRIIRLSTRASYVFKFMTLL